MTRWQTVFTTNQVYKADIVKNVLIHRGIQAVIVNKQDSAYKFGNIEVSVNQEYVLQAMKIVTEEITWKDE